MKSYILGALIGVLIGWCVMGFYTPQPQIVVNLPKDAKPLSTLNPVVSVDAKVIDEKRAVLWITVYRETLAKTNYSSYAIEAADRAVIMAYGPRP